MIVARQKLSALLMPLGVGAVCFSLGIALPWLVNPLSGWILLLSAWFCLGGVLSAVGGWRSWHPRGIGLMLDKHGLWWKWGWTFAWWRDDLRLVRWDQIIGVQLVHWTAGGDEESGLLIGLRDDGPVGSAEMAVMAEHARKLFGTVPWDKVILLHDDSWLWEPEAVMAHIQGSLSDPSIRETW